MKSFVKFRSQKSRRRHARRFAPWQSAAERLEDRCLLTHSLGVATDRVFVVESGTNPNQPSDEPFQFSDGTRWSNTTTDGSGLTQGQPTTITWGIVLDGSTITPDTVSHPSESSAGSSLISFFDGLYGSGPGGADLTARPWFSIFNDSFNRIEALSGINYVYQAITTSQVIPTTGGSASTPDILIGGHSIDGQSGTNILAYNYFPNVGDMVIDTDNTTLFGDTTSNSLAARNTIMHEAGHGIGLSHVESSSGAFLMEPFITTTFDGPQLDDILGYQRGYGDVLEKNGGNNTFGTATNLGTIGSGATASRGTLGSTTLVAASSTDFVSIDDESDVDFFSFTVTAAASVTLTLTPRGTTYLQGPQGGPETSFNSASQSDLTLQLIGVDGSTVLQTANVTGLGGTETVSNFALASAGTYFVRVSGTTTDKIQLYGLNAALSANAVPSFSKGANQTTLEDSGLQTVANWATNISPGLNESGQTVEFLVSNDNPGLFSTQPAVDSNGKLTYTPAENANGTATVTIFLHDNGGTANGGVDTSASQTFTITIASVNDVPTFSLPPIPDRNQKILEDGGAQSVAGFVTGITKGPNESTQAVDFQLTNNNEVLFSVQPTISATGTLTYTPAANRFGTATVTVLIHDDGGVANGGDDTSETQTFTITIDPVNDAPSFTKGANVAVLEDAGTKEFPDWATSISPGTFEGPGTSENQTVKFIVTADTPGLFLSTGQPNVSPDGKLTFTPADNVNGTTTVTIFMQDSGDALNGGANTSASQTFTITIAAVNDAPSFTKGPDLAVTVNSPAQTVNGWATTVLPHPNVFPNSSDELSQTLTFIVSNDNPLLFSVPPAISNTGVLTYTPSTAGVLGTATVTVRLRDSGGVTNGGVDFSAAQTFKITVGPTSNLVAAPSGKAVYTAPANAKLRAVVVDGLLNVQMNGVKYPTFDPATVTSLTITGGSKADEIDLSGLLAANYPVLTSVKINGGAGNDKIVGSALADSIDGGSGNDTLQGGLGNDTILGGSGNDGLSGQDDDDSLLGGDGNDTVLGGSGNDKLFGDNGNDSLIGGAGVDMIDGGAGRDTAAGGRGGPERGGTSTADLGDSIVGVEVLNEAFKKLFAFE